MIYRLYTYTAYYRARAYINVNPRLEVDLYYKSTSIRGQAIGGSVQALIIGKSLISSKLPYLDRYGLVEIKKIALEIIIFEIPLIQV